MKKSRDEFDINNGVLFGKGATFKGELNVEGLVIIEETASVSGDINAQAMLVAGRLTDGNIRISGEMCILSKAVVYCNLQAREIRSEPGAVFKGLFELL